MSRRPAATTQATIARALRAVKDANINASVSIKPDGEIVIQMQDGPLPPFRSVPVDQPRKIRL